MHKNHLLFQWWNTFVLPTPVFPHPDHRNKRAWHLIGDLMGLEVWTPGMEVKGWMLGNFMDGYYFYTILYTIDFIRFNPCWCTYTNQIRQPLKRRFNPLSGLCQAGVKAGKPILSFSKEGTRTGSTGTWTNCTGRFFFFIFNKDPLRFLFFIIIN